tara:strand:+ start:2393 stop:2605 length:213 start_codon:yes stop_codon:yes gene_type:complete
MFKIISAAFMLAAALSGAFVEEGHSVQKTQTPWSYTTTTNQHNLKDSAHCYKWFHIETTAAAKTPTAKKK